LHKCAAMATLTDYDTVLRFLHVLSGIVWIGMLYFFNLVNLPLIKFSLRKPYEFNMAEKATAHVLGKTLFWFRWGAASTLLFGLLLLGSAMQNPGFVSAAQAQGRSVLEYYFLGRGYQGYAIGMGALFALVMAFNVWFVIWPRQQKILANNKAIAASTDEAEKKRLGDANAPMVKVATMASRINTWLSVPMLWGMVFGAHFAATDRNAWVYPAMILAVVLVIMALYATQKPKKAA
jgi:uncharacterized membrane protein